VHGNAPVEVTTDNAHALLLAAGRADVPVGSGSPRPIAQGASFAPDIHGADGLGGMRHLLPDASSRPRVPAVEEILRQSRRHAGALEIVAVGPLTNLALALLTDPELPGRVRRVYVMGGAFDVPGNVTHSAEANIFHDPEAADLVFTAPWPVTAVGLDVTMRVLLEPEDLARLSADERPFVAALGRMSEFYARAYARRLGRAACPQHDALAALAAFSPELVRLEARPVRVELRGAYTRGMTVSVRDAQAAPIDVAVEVDAAAARERILAGILACPAPGSA